VFPKRCAGTWAAGSCTSPDALLHVTARSVAKLPAAGPARLVRFRAMREQDGWTLGIGAGAEAPRIMLRPDGAALDLAEPDENCATTACPGRRG
jgi:hypothetical protein